MSCNPLFKDYFKDYDYDRDANFARLRTFAWLPVKVNASELLIKDIKGAVNIELEAKGFMQNKAHPDFLIAIHFKRMKRKEALTYSDKGRVRDFRIYEERTYTLVIVDADSKAMIWRGTALRKKDDEPLFLNAEKRRERTYNTVEKTLNNFPPPEE